jgi:hypothetical protein
VKAEPVDPARLEEAPFPWLSIPIPSVDYNVDRTVLVKLIVSGVLSDCGIDPSTLPLYSMAQARVFFHFGEGEEIFLRFRERNGCMNGK